MGSLNPYDRIKSPLLKKCFAILRLDKARTYASLDKICDVCNTEMNSTHRLLECKKSFHVRDSFMSKINRLTHFNTLSKEDKLKVILNLSCENQVTSDIMKYIQKFVLFIA